MLYSHRSRRSLSSGLPLRYVTREPSGEIFSPTIVGPANGGASNNRSMVSSAAPAPLATAQATNAGTRYLPEFRESVMEFQPFLYARFLDVDACREVKVYYSRVIR